MKRSILTLLAMLATTQAFAFPDMRLYPHDVIKTIDGLTSYLMQYDNVIQLNYAKYKNLYYYQGHCGLTGHNIYIDDADKIDSVCTIFKNDYEEKSYTTSLQHSGEYLTDIVIYSFKGGRVIVFECDGKRFAAFQSF